MESEHSFYVVLADWAKKPLGYGRCGAVVQAMAFKKRGNVMYGEVALKYSHGVDSDGWLLLNEKNVFQRFQECRKEFEGSQFVLHSLGWIESAMIDGSFEKKALVMEYVDGWTLSEVCQKWHRSLWILMDIIILRWLIQIGRGLSYIHKCNVTHNDLKMHNIMVSKNGKYIKIIDFGHSRLGPKNNNNNNNSEERMSKATDLKALGRILAQLIGQRSPLAYVDFQNDSSYAGCELLLRKHGNSYFGVETNFWRLFSNDPESIMTADEFTSVLLMCKFKALQKQQAKMNASSTGKDYALELGRHLKKQSSNQLKSLEGGTIKQKL